MPKTRNLTDLYVIGKEVLVNDGKGEDIPVWIQKISPTEQEDAVRKANAKRSVILYLKRLPIDHPDRAPYSSEVLELSVERQMLVDLLVASDLAKVSDAREAEVAAEEEWANDNYLQGLYDAWNNGLKEEYFINEEDETAREEPKRVFEELKRFADQVEKRMASEKRGFEKEYKNKSDDKLFALSVDKIIETQADLAWLDEYRKSELFYGVRTIEDHNERYFSDKTLIEHLAPQVIGKLVGEYASLNVDATEGKD